MDLNEAKKCVEELGIGFFYESVVDTSVEDIIHSIQTLVLVTPSSGFDIWGTRRNALGSLLQGSTEEMLESIVKRDFGIWPHQVGGGRAFLQRLHDVISAAIEQKKQQGT